MKDTLIFGWLYTTFSILNRMPQIYKNYARKKTGDLSLVSYGCQCLSCILFCIHGIVVDDPTAVVCGAVATVQTIIILIQMYMYRR